ncbi:MAG: hypothetical protein CME30_03520 [Gemmatimonadetes bacterium]|nr:hypothetical protein [Gemmatimonadota bacterium]
MSLSGTILAGLVICAGFFSFWVYSRLEIAISSWKWLATLRFVILSLVLVLIWDPLIPDSRMVSANGTRWVLVDGSQSMKSGTQSQIGPLSQIIGKIESLEDPPSRVLLFGETPRFIPVDSLDLVDFEDKSSELVPALISVAETGGSQVLVLTDFRIDDARDVDSYGQKYGLDIEFERVQLDRRNVGVKDFVIYRSDSSDESLFARATIFSEGILDGEQIEVQIFEEENLVAEEAISPISEGNTSSVEISLPASKNTDLVMYKLVVRIAGDEFQLDDQKRTYFDSTHSGNDIVFLSFQPDWEPRFLLPALKNVSGLSIEGFLKLSNEQFLNINDVETDDMITTENDVREAVANSGILVVHGLSENVPGWVMDTLVTERPSLIFVENGTVGNMFGISTQENVVEGEWYLEENLKPSPLAATLSDIDFGSLSPLSTVLPLTGSSNHVAPLESRQNGLGQVQPPLVLVNNAEERKVLVLAAGFWRWASRGGSSGIAYRRLWSAVFGWLMASDAMGNTGLVEPEFRIWGEDDLVLWETPGLVGSNVNLVISENDSVISDTTIVINGEGQFVTQELTPGNYNYRAVAVENGDLLGDGRFSVENHSLEWLTRPGDLRSIKNDQGIAISGSGNFNRPLHTFVSPYLILILLLAMEWIGRRQGGLR